MEIDGTTRRWILDVPDGAGGAPMPLLLDFHGLGHSGAGVWEVSGFRALARAGEPFATVYPEGLPVRLVTPHRVFEGNGWEVRRIDGNRDLAFVARLLDRIGREQCIDLDRVWATGFSNGAYLDQLLACTMADRIAAIAPVSGGVLRDVPCRPARPVPVLFHHGRADEIIPVEQARRARDAWARIDGCATGPPSPTGGGTAISCTVAPGCRGGSTVDYCEGDFGHRWPSSATARILGFLRAHPMHRARP